MTTTNYGFTKPALGDDADITDVGTALEEVDTAILALESSHALKQRVVAVATTNINLASLPAAIDGVTMATDDLFLCTAQSTASQNGLQKYSSAAGAASRPPGFTAGTGTAAVKAGHLVSGGMGGTANGGIWQNSNTGAITVDTTGLTYVKAGSLQGVQAFAATGTILSNGGNVINYIGAASQTLTLPPAVKGQSFEVWNLDTDNVTIGRAGSDTISDLAGVVSITSFTLPGGAGIRIQCMDAGVWRVLQINTPLVSALPAVPLHSYEVIYIADGTAGIYWHFKYASGTTSWDFVGGAPLTGATTTCATGLPGYAAPQSGTVPALTIPSGLGGKYNVRVSALIENSGVASSFISPSGAGITADDSFAAMFTSAAAGHRVAAAKDTNPDLATLVAGTLTCQTRVVGNTGTFTYIVLSAQPVKIS